MTPIDNIREKLEGACRIAESWPTEEVSRLIRDALSMLDTLEDDWNLEVKWNGEEEDAKREQCD